MNPFQNISEKNLHHAYILVGDLALSRKGMEECLKNLEIEFIGNPDVRQDVYDTLTIDTVRELTRNSLNKDFEGGKKIFIIETNTITVEAQNALLKIFEEPTAGTHFFILMPQEQLLPTLRSRVQVIYIENSQTRKSESMLDIPITKRLEIVKEITDGIADEEKTKQDAIALLNNIETELYSKGLLEEYEKLLICQKTRRALYDRGAPVKMILEHLVISL